MVHIESMVARVRCMQEMVAISDVATLCEALSHHICGATMSLDDRIMHAPHGCTPGNGSRWVSAPMWPRLIYTTRAGSPENLNRQLSDAEPTPDAEHMNGSPDNSNSASSLSSSLCMTEPVGQHDRGTAGEAGTGAGGHLPGFELGKCPSPAPIVCTISCHQRSAQLERCTLLLNEAVAVVFERTCSDTHVSHVTFQGVLQHAVALCPTLLSYRHRMHACVPRPALPVLSLGMHCSCSVIDSLRLRLKGEGLSLRLPEVQRN